MTRPLAELPVIRFQCPLQDLLRVDVRDTDRHEISKMIQTRLAGPRWLVHGFPNDPCNIRELIQLRVLVIVQRWMAILGCPLRRLAIETHDNTLVWIDGERERGPSCPVRVIGHSVPLEVDIRLAWLIALVRYTDQVILPSFVLCRILRTMSAHNVNTMYEIEDVRH
jgi:hypothetical protein